MKNFIYTFLLMLGVVFGATAQSQPKNVIIYIGDGFGTSAKTAARMAMGQGTIGKRFTGDAGFRVLSLDNLKYTTNVTTHSANSWITDSGPGASVYACGEKGKIDNESISFDVAKGESVETILEHAKKEGYAVGIVTTTRVTHATPAAFASHIWFRDLEDYIASQFISSSQQQYEEIFNNAASKIAPYNPDRDWQLPNVKNGVEVDVILGGGARHFLPNNINDIVVDKNGAKILDAKGNEIKISGKRIDSVNLVEIAKSRGYVHVNSRDALLNLNIDQYKNNPNAKLLGLFNSSHCNYEQDRQIDAPWEPSLFEMTEMAIKVLQAKGGSKGFFLIVEGGRIDHLEHANSGGITVIAGTPTNKYVVDADKPSYKGGGEAIYAVTPTSERHSDIFGSDYLIKEVLAFDYSVAQGRKLLADNNSKTLIFSTSDHECGGTAIVGLHDSKDAQNNGTKIRTYALGPKQNDISAKSSGAATATTVAAPTNVKRGDIDHGTVDVNGWYPNYSTYKFQDRDELWPKVDTNGRRIVVAYASNPITNGNGDVAGGTPGNHTPMDIWVGGEDNVGGSFASRITGQGLLDNTFLTKIMSDFLELQGFIGLTDPGSGSGKMDVYPNPASGLVNINMNMAQNAHVSITAFDITGKKVADITSRMVFEGNNKIEWNTSNIPAGTYVISATDGIRKLAQKIVISH